MMKKKTICCAGLVLSMICLIGCAAKGTQNTPIPASAAISPQAEAPVASKPDTAPEQTVQDTTPVVEQTKEADTSVNADAEVPQTAPVPTTQHNVAEDIPSETVHAKTGYVEPEPTPERPDAGQQRLPLPRRGAGGCLAGDAGGQGAGHGGLHVPSAHDAGGQGQCGRRRFPLQRLHCGRWRELADLRPL